MMENNVPVKEVNADVIVTKTVITIIWRCKCCKNSNYNQSFGDVIVAKTVITINHLAARSKSKPMWN